MHRHRVVWIKQQVDMRSGDIDWSGSCGNLASAVALFALAEGLVKSSANNQHKQATCVRVYQTNLQYSIQVIVPGEEAAEDHQIPGA